jgi:hypothetical protein
MSKKSAFSRLTPEEKKRALKEATSIIGVAAGLFSKFLLESQGYIVDFKINGENIEDIEKFFVLTIQQKLELAIKEERFNDCIILKKILDENKINHEK